jgi:hypothetical protein
MLGACAWATLCVGVRVRVRVSRPSVGHSLLFCSRQNLGKFFGASSARPYFNFDKYMLLRLVLACPGRDWWIYKVKHG